MERRSRKGFSFFASNGTISTKDLKGQAGRMRRRIYEIIEKSEGDDVLSSIYDYFMIVVIIISLIPLAFKQEVLLLKIVDKVTVSIFIMDYLLRLMTADYKYHKKSITSFLRYPFSFMAIVDLISILPSLTIVNSGFKLLRILRMIRALRVVRVFKAMRYSKSFEIIGKVLKTSKNSLIAVCVLAIGYILISALVIFNVEPDSFQTFFVCNLLGDDIAHNGWLRGYLSGFNHWQNCYYGFFYLWNCNRGTSGWYHYCGVYE